MTHTATPGSDIVLKVYRAASDLEELRAFWGSRQTAPAGELDFYLSEICSRPEFVRPHVIVMFKNRAPQSLLLGRLEPCREPRAGPGGGPADPGKPWPGNRAVAGRPGEPQHQPA